MGIKMGNKKEIFWTTARDKLEESILQYEESLIADKEMLILANRRIKEEQEEYKKTLNSKGDPK